MLSKTYFVFRFLFSEYPIFFSVNFFCTSENQLHAFDNTLRIYNFVVKKSWSIKLTGIH